MNYILMPSLEHMTLTKIAITLWNQEQRLIIQEKLPSYHTRLKINDSWQAIEDKVIKNVLQLSLPNVMKEKILCIIKPIGFEILNWLIDANCLLFDNKQYLDELYWTAAGTIDRKRTVQIYIKNRKLDNVKHLYIFACNYCIEDEILKLWNSFSKRDREIFCRKKAVALNQKDLVCYWNSFMLRKVKEWNDITWHNNYSARQNAFLMSSIQGNIDATKYFFQKLNSRERTECLVELTDSFVQKCYFYSTDVMYFLLPFFDEEQEIKIFEKNRINVLNGFLKWPWQSLFMEMANQTWNFITESESYKYLYNFSAVDFEIVASYIIDLSIIGYKDYNYKKLFDEFWQQMPKKFKRRLVNNLTLNPEILSKILKAKDLENFFSILKEATAEECLKIFSHQPSIPIMSSYPYDKLYCLPFMTQVYVSFSSESNDKLVKEIKEGIFLTRPKEEIEKEKDIWNELFRRLHNHIHRNSKRTSEEERGPIKCMKLQIAESEDV